MSGGRITTKIYDFYKQKSRLQEAFLFSMFLLKVCVARSLDIGNGIVVNYQPEFSKYCFYRTESVRVFSEVTMDDCVKECSLRGNCVLLQYRRTFKICELYYSSSPGQELLTGCVHVLRHDMTIPPLPCPVWCQYYIYGSRCDLNSQDCVYEECFSTPSVQDGILLGNMNSIDSKLKLQCNGVLGVPSGDNTITTCQHGGTWTPLPQVCVEHYWFLCPSSDDIYTVLYPPGGEEFAFRLVHEVQLPYQAAFDYCLAEGGHFIREFPQYKKTFLRLMMRQCLGYQSRYWIDGTNLLATDYNDISQWETSTRDPMVNDFWYPGQPNNPGTDHCAYANMENPDEENLVCDWACDKLYFFICEK